MPIDNEKLEGILEIAKVAALQAGEAILSIYDQVDFDVQVKDDDSPLTKADLASHKIIIEKLQASFPEIPCLSEESESIAYEQRRNWDQCFIIDPLDGTKEFIARNDEFTVNIALIEKGHVKLGVIYAPVLKTFYFAAENMGAFKQLENQAAEKIHVRKVQEINNEKHVTVVASRRHGLSNVEKLCQNFAAYSLTSCGSSLKMCLVAEGVADFYPRLAPTSEWDTAAAQSIVEQAGGKLVSLDYQPLIYNQKESLLNPYFLTLGDPNFNWQETLHLSPFIK